MTSRQHKAVDMLHRLGCSCVIDDGLSMTVCRQRGVSDLLRILRTTPSLLAGSFIADKVVGKGAAALMAVGGVSSVYADTLSQSALDMLQSAGITVSYGVCVPAIINRAGTGICPVEQLCAAISDPAKCIPLIESFIDSLPSPDKH